MLADLSKDAEIFLQVSDLTELECLVLPLRQKDQPVPRNLWRVRRTNPCEMPW